MDYKNSLDYEMLNEDMRDQVDTIIAAGQRVAIQRTNNDSYAAVGKIGGFDLSDYCTDNGDLKDMYRLVTFDTEAEFEAAYYG